MPLFPNSYKPGLLFQNPHVNTTWSSMVRKVPSVNYTRSRFELTDGDFVDIDWSYGKNPDPGNGRNRGKARRCVVLLHGLGGGARGVYIQGMVRVLNEAGWDTASYNFRGAGGEMNRLPLTYHSGRTDDLDEFTRSLAEKGNYDDMVLLGFSLGGNVALKYLGEQGDRCLYKAGTAISVPMDLAGSSKQLEKSRFYMNYLLDKLFPFMEEKKKRHPDLIDLRDFKTIRSFREYDSRYTAPLNGFDSAEDYWAQSSSLQYLDHIRRPVMVLNALDDPFLSPDCFPFTVAETSGFVHLCIPDYGGHVGFMLPGGKVYTEVLIPDFFERFVPSER